MIKGTLYGIGTGPGDPELITVKAVKIIDRSDVIAVPDRGTGENTALDTVRQYLKGQRLLYCSTPMIRDTEVLEACYEKTAAEICRLLDEGLTVSYITLGDPTVYSTYMYVHRKVAERGYNAVAVPGITSFCASAARLGEPLCERDEGLLIIPGAEDFSSVRESSGIRDMKISRVYMKTGRDMEKLRDNLRREGMIENAYAVEKCGMEDEKIYRSLDDMEKGAGYYSVVIVKDRK